MRINKPLSCDFGLFFCAMVSHSASIFNFLVIKNDEDEDKKMKKAAASSPVLKTAWRHFPWSTK